MKILYRQYTALQAFLLLKYFCEDSKKYDVISINTQQDTII
jgi:hypothetical protein